MIVCAASQSGKLLQGFNKSYRFTTYQDARRVGLVDGLGYLKQIFYASITR